MCGICGVVSLEGPLHLRDGVPERMVGALRHRGPDEFGAWRDERAFLGHTRLSIIDLVTGQQPLTSEDGRRWIVFNGEIFNYIELARELESLGHVLRTRSDTEVIVHAYEQWGESCVDRFNGQFAIALWDTDRRTLFLARDRYGVRPLFLARHDGHLLFASEIKALAAWPGFHPSVDPQAVAEVFTYWVTVPPGTVFEGVVQLPAGHTAILELDRGNGPTEKTARRTATTHETTVMDAPGWPRGLRLRRYWHPSFLPADEDRRFVDRQEQSRLAEELRERLVQAAVIRLRADVPVGSYLSGGLDSSAIAAIIHRYTDRRLKTFSVGFEDRGFDESDWQRMMVAHLGTDHRLVTVSAEDIAGHFPDVIWHAETPILRTAPAPLYALSELVRGENYKVVLTGEGADEVWAGYNIFREAKVRRFWSRRPQDQRRALLLTRLYPYLELSPPQFLTRFYGQGLDRPDEPFFSHRPRWSNTGMMTTFLADEATEALRRGDPERRLAGALPADFMNWGPVGRAQYLEMTTFLSGYLMNSQGDRMLMGHSVEGRFPFLDPDLGTFASTVPASVKLQSLNEKSLLKQAVRDLLPPAIVARDKQPYRAPDSASFTARAGRTTVLESLNP
jgi:asparagine synthase (glutamine-hydrolysing)